jgi:hypothetical protein
MVYLAVLFAVTATVQGSIAGRERSVSIDALQQVVSAYKEHWGEVSTNAQVLATPLLDRMNAKIEILTARDPADAVTTTTKIVETAKTDNTGTVVVMADTRSFLAEGAIRQPSWLPLGKNGERIPYWSLAAALNHNYAVHFNYTFVYFHFNNTDRRSMPHENGPLKNTWCKVHALRTALQMYQDKTRFLWLDSDAYVAQRKMSLSEFISTESARRGDNVLEKASVIAAAEPSVACLEEGLSEAECRINSGVLILQRGVRTKGGRWAKV